MKSGLRVVEGILGEIEDVSFQRLTAHDVVRHKLVGQIVAAYDEFDAGSGTGRRRVALRRRRTLGDGRRSRPMSIEVAQRVRLRARRHAGSPRSAGS